MVPGPVDFPDRLPARGADLIAVPFGDDVAHQAIRPGFPDLAQAFLPASRLFRPARTFAQPQFRRPCRTPSPPRVAASNTTPAGRWFSGHVITRWPRYFHQALPNRHTATPANPTTTRSKRGIGIQYSEITLASTVAVCRRYLPRSPYLQGSKPNPPNCPARTRPPVSACRCGLFRTA